MTCSQPQLLMGGGGEEGLRRALRRAESLWLQYDVLSATTVDGGGGEEGLRRAESLWLQYGALSAATVDGGGGGSEKS